jgi:hypothetical protein
MDEEAWQDVVDEYNKEYIPKWRDPRYSGEKLEDGRYEWELEQEYSNDFVKNSIVPSHHPFLLKIDLAFSPLGFLHHLSNIFL